MAVPGSIYKNITLSATVTGTPPPSALDDSGRSTTDQESVISITDAEAAEADAIANGTAAVTSFQLTTSGGNVSQVALPGTDTAATMPVTTADLSNIIDNISLTDPTTLTPDLTPVSPSLPITSLMADFEPDQSLLDDTEPAPEPTPTDPTIMNIYGDMNRGAGPGRR